MHRLIAVASIAGSIALPPMQTPSRTRLSACGL
jgi:hypothetical protein